MEPPADVTFMQYGVTRPNPLLATFHLNSAVLHSICPLRHPLSMQLKHLNASAFSVR